MSFEVEYNLFNGRSKKKPNNNLKIDQTPILNSIVNTYALSLFLLVNFMILVKMTMLYLKRWSIKKEICRLKNLWMKFAKFVVKTKI